MVFMYVDRREPAEIINEARKNGIVKLVTLPVGDFANEKKNIFIERKTPMDVWGRVFNRTWDLQIQHLQQYCLDKGAVPWLIVEGGFEEAHVRSKGKVPVEQTKGAVISAAVRYGVNVWCTGNIGESVEVAARICQKGDENKLASPKQIPFRRNIKDSRVGVMMNVFRISARQSEELLKAHGSVIGVLRVLRKNPKALYLVDGMGPGTVKRMKRLMETKFE